MPSSAASTSATTCASSACRATAPRAPWAWRSRARPTARHLGKINAQGVWLEELERNPARFLPDTTHEELIEHSGDVVQIDLNRPMAEIRAELSKYPVKTRLSLSGPVVVARDIAHAKIAERLAAGEPMPQYLRDHAVYYAGPAKTPTATPPARSAPPPPAGWTPTSTSSRPPAARS